MKFFLMSVLLLILTDPFAGFGQEGLRVRLLETVEVRGRAILLSDLLPPESSPALRRATAEINIARAPEVGSFRILEASQIRRTIKQTALLQEIAIPSRVVVRHAGFPVNIETIRGAIVKFMREQSGQFPQLSDEAKISWSPNVTAERENAAIEVLSMRWDPQQARDEVRLRCSDRSECSCFLALIKFPLVITAEWQAKTGAALIVANSLPAKPTKISAPKAAHGPILAQAGKPAMLILRDVGMRISMQVICLDRGALSQQVRAVDKHSHRMFHARVIGAALLEAQL